jgi:hypothetical protein
VQRMRGKKHTATVGIQGLLVLCIALGSPGADYSQAAGPQGTPTVTDGVAPQNMPQERFLQNFISRSLGDTGAESKGAPAVPVRDTVPVPPSLPAAP